MIKDPSLLSAPATGAGSCRQESLGALAAALVAVAAGLVLGVLTAFGQGWLPSQVASLANSSGPWALTAFAVAMLAPSARAAAGCAAGVLVSLLVGYVAANVACGLPSSSGLLLFWGAAALTVGPLLGLGGYSLRRRHGLPAAVGAGAMSGVLIGEGAYGLRYLAESTYPPYWWGSITAGTFLVAVAISARLRHRRLAVATMLVTALVSVAFVMAYAGAGSVIGVL